ncbi:MAG TPA: phosphatase PAP2 family protein [Polyangiaceae bacterium]|nr:phosphatase PAP2 family protein [Polyangiaceae bacterium]
MGASTAGASPGGGAPASLPAVPTAGSPGQLPPPAGSPGRLPPPRVGATALPESHVWDPSWRRFGLWDYVGTAATLGAFYAVEATMSGPTKATWTKPLPLDRPFRDLIAADSRQARGRADTYSDIFWYASVAYPVAASLVVPPLRGKGGVAMSWQLTMMNLEAFAVVSLLTRLPHKTIGRQRPNGIGCADDPEYSEQCGQPGQNVSFFGGHTAVSTTGAGLACAHHLYGHLYGDETADTVACGAALVAGQMVSVFRLQADKHWLSDNIVGSLVGFSVGFGLPTFLHYKPFWRPRRIELAPPSAAPPSSVRVTFMPLLDRHRAGAALGGVF